MPKIPTYIAEGKPGITRAVRVPSAQLPSAAGLVSPGRGMEKAGEEIYQFGERLGILARKLADQQADLDVSNAMRVLRTGFAQREAEVGDAGVHPDEYAPTLLRDLGEQVKNQADLMRGARAQRLFQIHANDFMADQEIKVRFEGLKRQHALIQTTSGLEMRRLANDAVSGVPGAPAPPPPSAPSALPAGDIEDIKAFEERPYEVRPIDLPSMTYDVGHNRWVPTEVKEPGVVEKQLAQAGGAAGVGAPAVENTLEEVKKVRLGNPQAVVDGIQNVLTRVARGIITGEQGRAELKEFTTNIQLGEIKRDFADAGNRVALLDRLLKGGYYNALSPDQAFNTWHALSRELRADQDRQQAQQDRALAKAEVDAYERYFTKANTGTLTDEEQQAISEGKTLVKAHHAPQLRDVMNNPPSPEGGSRSILALQQEYVKGSISVARAQEYRERLNLITQDMHAPNHLATLLYRRIGEDERAATTSLGAETNDLIKQAKDQYVALVGVQLRKQKSFFTTEEVDFAGMSVRIRDAKYRGETIDPLKIAQEFYERRMATWKAKSKEDRMIEGEEQ